MFICTKHSSVSSCLRKNSVFSVQEFKLPLEIRENPKEFF